MTRTAMIVAGVLLATTSAQALELTCQAPIILVGTQSKDAHDTAVGTYVVHTEEDGWEITYRMGNGSEIRRSTQYEIRDTSDTKMTQWRGVFLKRSSFQMIGEVKRESKTGRLVYIEWAYDRGKLTMNSAAYCRDIQSASTMSPMPSQPQQEPAKDWPKWLKE
jgi:hypothetical protein